MPVARRAVGDYTEDISPAILHAGLGGGGSALLLLLVQLLEVFAFVLFGELEKKRPKLVTTLRYIQRPRDSELRPKT